MTANAKDIEIISHILDRCISPNMGKVATNEHAGDGLCLIENDVMEHGDMWGTCHTFEEDFTFSLYSLQRSPTTWAWMIKYLPISGGPLHILFEHDCVVGLNALVYLFLSHAPRGPIAPPVSR